MMEIPPSLGEHHRKVGCGRGGFLAGLLRRCSTCAPQPLLSKHRVVLSHPLTWWMCVARDYQGAELTSCSCSCCCSVCSCQAVLSVGKCRNRDISRRKGLFTGHPAWMKRHLLLFHPRLPSSVFAGARGMSLQAFPPLWLQPLFKGFPQEQIFVVT